MINKHFFPTLRFPSYSRMKNYLRFQILAPIFSDPVANFGANFFDSVSRETLLPEFIWKVTLFKTHFLKFSLKFGNKSLELFPK